MVNRTIWGEMQGKWSLGSISPSGREQALSGKWAWDGVDYPLEYSWDIEPMRGKFIGDAVACTYPTFDMRLPVRASFDPTSLAIGAAIVALLYSLAKR